MTFKTTFGFVVGLKTKHSVQCNNLKQFKCFEFTYSLCIIVITKADSTLSDSLLFCANLAHDYDYKYILKQKLCGRLSNNPQNSVLLTYLGTFSSPKLCALALRLPCEFILSCSEIDLLYLHWSCKQTKINCFVFSGAKLKFYKVKTTTTWPQLSP